MKVLIIARHTPPQRYLVHLTTEKLIKEIRDLINDNKHSLAVTAAFTKGIFEREVSEADAHRIDAALILSDSNARWDLTK